MLENDVAARRIVLDSEQYTLIDNTLYHLHTPRQKRKDQVSSVVRQVCLPRCLTDEVTKAYHDNNGHIGFDKLYESIRVKYIWPRMYADLSEYVRSCIECQQTKRPVHLKKAPLQSEDVFSRWHLDYLGPLPLSNGFRYILVAIDSTSLVENDPVSLKVSSHSVQSVSERRYSTRSSAQSTTTNDYIDTSHSDAELSRCPYVTTRCYTYVHAINV